MAVLSRLTNGGRRCGVGHRSEQILFWDVLTNGGEATWYIMARVRGGQCGHKLRPRFAAEHQSGNHRSSIGTGVRFSRITSASILRSGCSGVQSYSQRFLATIAPQCVWYRCGSGSQYVPVGCPRAQLSMQMKDQRRRLFTVSVVVAVVASMAADTLLSVVRVAENW